MQLPATSTNISAILEISQDRQQFTSSLIDFKFYRTPTRVDSIFPVAGPVLGGTNVTVTGDSFINSNNGKISQWLQCVFSPGGTVQAQFVSAKQVVCTSPPLAAVQHTAVSLSVSLAGGQHLMLASAPFQYFPDFVVVSGSTPQSSDMKGGPVINVLGLGFVDTKAIVVKFGATDVPAHFVSPSIIQARAPALYNYQCSVKQDCWLNKISAEATQPAGVEACTSANRATHSPYAKLAAGTADKTSIQFCSVSDL